MNREAIGLFIEAWNSVGDTNQELEISALTGVARAYANSGKFASALPLYQEALGRARDLHDRGREGQIHGALGNAHLYSGDINSARLAFQTSLAISEECSDGISQARVLCGVGACDFAEGLYVSAKEVQLRAIEIASQHRDPLGEAEVRHGLSVTLRQLGETAEALAQARQALTIFDRIAPRLGERTRQLLKEWHQNLDQSRFSDDSSGI